jgi:cyanate lyase
MLNEVPMRGEGAVMPPTDPLIYRFYELVMVNGLAWKPLIDEEFGDGIMSAVDFGMVMERLADPKGDRVKITMSGKFCRSSITARRATSRRWGIKRNKAGQV